MNPSDVTRVLLVEVDELLRAGIAALLATDPRLLLIGEADDGPAAMTLFEAQRPDVVIMDLRLPSVSGTTVIAMMKQRRPDARVLVLTYHVGDQDVFAAIRAWAMGYLRKGVSASAFIEAIHTVARGRRHFDSATAKSLADGAMGITLSRRETQVLERMFLGLTNPQIAQQLSISARTVTMFVSQILEKLGAKTHTEAVAIALRRGLLTTDGSNTR